MTYFEAMEIHMDLCVGLEYKDLFDKSNSDVAVEYVRKYGVDKIYEAVKVLCNHLDEERKRYLNLIKIINIVERLEDK
jgi:hypothetical protein